jgi:uncharacterized membrane protein
MNLIYIHAAFGGIALLAGLVALIARKGKSIHKKFGLLFFYSMLMSALLALIIATLPDHKSPFLFSIGIFSAYLILTGYRALQFKVNSVKPMDKVLSWLMVVTGITMVLYPIVLEQKINIVLTVFGIIGLSLSLRDLNLYRQPEKLKRGWLKLHLGKMIGGYIAASTAFVVVNNFFYGIYGWFVPGIVGGIYIAYWMRKLNRKKMRSAIPGGL